MQLAAGLLLCLGAWVALRRTVGAGWVTGAPGPGRWASSLLDLLPVAAGFTLALVALGRPVLAGLAIAAPAAGLIVTDRVKRVVLDEPVMFVDRAELWEVVRHPQLYIPFVGVVPMIAGTLAIAAALAGLIWLEPPLWPLPLGTAVLTLAGAAAIAVALFRLPRHRAILTRLAPVYERWRPARDPATDAERFGMLATFVVQATIAAVERPRRQAEARAPGLPPLVAGGGPIVIVQAESFVFADRLHPALAGAAPEFARLAARSVRTGRFVVPCWGANTIRTEFEALTGIDTRRLGLDRFNPYEAFAQVPLPSLAAAARAAGRRTICLHPYDRRFYARDKVMPALGFDRFVGIEGFADAPRAGAYVADVALAERIAEAVRTEGPDVLIFAMSMENHGPWGDAAEAQAAVPPHLGLRAGEIPAFGRWLRRLARTDAMLPVLTDALAGTGGWLAFYGDHQPSFPGLFARLGILDRDADYLIWRDGAAGRGHTADLAAYDLAPRLLDLIAQAAA